MWEHLDGSSNLKRITPDYLQEFGEFAPQFVADLIAGLSRGGFLVTSAIHGERKPSAGLEPPTPLLTIESGQRMTPSRR